MMSPLDPVKPASVSKLTRNQYIFRMGVLGWGVPVAILFSIVQGFEHGWDGLIVRLIPALILFPIGGIFFGLFMWKVMQRPKAAQVDGSLKE